jgi:hypothetical protein
MLQNETFCDLKNMNITCDNNEMIAIESLNFYYHPDCNNTCCSFNYSHHNVGANNNDFQNIRRNCSGKSSCAEDLNGTRQFGSIGEELPSYVVLKYYCIPSKTKQLSSSTIT